MFNPDEDCDQFSEAAQHIFLFAVDDWVDMLPGLMICVLSDEKHQNLFSMAEMIVFAMDVPPDQPTTKSDTARFKNLLTPDELIFFQKWIMAIAEMEFIQVCQEEYARVVNFWIRPEKSGVSPTPDGLE